MPEPRPLDLEALALDLERMREDAAVSAIEAHGYGPWPAEVIAWACCPCTCIEAYWRRRLIDPDCGWHAGAMDIVPCLVAAGLIQPAG